jgi:hypothetical protein
MERTVMLNHLVKIARRALMVGIAAHADSAGGQQLI